MKTLPHRPDQVAHGSPCLGTIDSDVPFIAATSYYRDTSGRVWQAVGVYWTDLGDPAEAIQRIAYRAGDDRRDQAQIDAVCSVLAGPGPT